MSQELLPLQQIHGSESATPYRLPGISPIFLTNIPTNSASQCSDLEEQSKGARMELDFQHRIVAFTVAFYYLIQLDSLKFFSSGGLL